MKATNSDVINLLKKEQAMQVFVMMDETKASFMDVINAAVNELFEGGKYRITLKPKSRLKVI